MRGGGRRRLAVPFLLGAVVVLTALVLLGSRADPGPAYTLEADADGVTTLTGQADGVEVYRFTLPQGVEPLEPDAVVLGPGDDAPVQWAVTVDDIPAEGALADVVDPADLRERLPAYGDGRSLLVDPRPIEVDGVGAWTHDILDVDGEPYVTRSILVDHDGRRYAIGLALPEVDAAEFLDALTSGVLDSWRWID